jgi:putative tricarboxylic transport membrane protein
VGRPGRGGQDARLAVSTPAVEVGGKQVKTLKDQGIDVEITNWRGVVAPPDIKPAERDAAIAAMKKLHDSDEWKAALEKNEWTDFFKPVDESSRSWTRRTRG